MTHLLRIIFAAAWASGFICTAGAAEISVKAGTSDEPIAKAIATAKEGDTLVIGPGIYPERVRVEKRLTLRGEQGAILDGTTLLKTEWAVVEGMEKVFTTASGKRPEGLLVDGKFIAEIRFDRAQKSGEWHWQTLLAKGPPLGGFKNVRALWMHHPKEKKIYLRLEDGVAPEKAALTVVMSGKPLIEVAAEGVIVEGLTLRGGAEAVVLGEGAKDCVVRRCKVTSYENAGIMITGGASNCTVEDCDITRGVVPLRNGGRRQRTAGRTMRSGAFTRMWGSMTVWASRSSVRVREIASCAIIWTACLTASAWGIRAWSRWTNRSLIRITDAARRSRKM